MELAVAVSVIIAIISVFTSCLIVKRVKKQISKCMTYWLILKMETETGAFYLIQMSLSRRLPMKSMILSFLTKTGFPHFVKQTKQIGNL